MLTFDEAILKIKKLMSLSNSSNPSEAASALAKAQDIMDRYNINNMMVSEGSTEKQDEPIIDGAASGLRDTYIDSDGRMTTWRSYLIGTIAKANHCSCYKRVHRDFTGIGLFGRKSDIDTCRYLYNMIRMEIDRLTFENTCRYLYNMIRMEIDRLTFENAHRQGRVYANNYRLGCVGAVQKKLEEQRQALP